LLLQLVAAETAENWTEAAGIQTELDRSPATVTEKKLRERAAAMAASLRRAASLANATFTQAPAVVELGFPVESISEVK
jgi:molybdopterin-biosynthesis enzyme MoeA-like protein